MARDVGREPMTPDEARARAEPPSGLVAGRGPATGSRGADPRPAWPPAAPGAEEVQLEQRDAVHLEPVHLHAPVEVGAGDAARLADQAQLLPPLHLRRPASRRCCDMWKYAV